MKLSVQVGYPCVLIQEAGFELFFYWPPHPDYEAIIYVADGGVVRALPKNWIAV